MGLLGYIPRYCDANELASLRPSTGLSDRYSPVATFLVDGCEFGCGSGSKHEHGSELELDLEPNSTSRERRAVLVGPESR